MANDRLHKLLRMMESSFDGERSNAASMIAKMAADAKQTVPEFLQANLGSNRSHSAFYPESDAIYWKDRYGESEGRMQALASRAARAERLLQEVRDELQRERKNSDQLRVLLRHAESQAKPKNDIDSRPPKKPVEADSPPWEGEDTWEPSRKLLDQLYRLSMDIAAKDPFLLDDRETDFVNDVLNRYKLDRQLTTKQRAFALRIIKKLLNEMDGASII